MEHQKIRQFITNEFYWLHKHPELSYEEKETTKRIKDDLQQAGIEVLPTSLPTGVIARIGTGKAPVIAIRCDIDALPLQEKTNLPYRSQVDGRMHGCGHDFHTAAILGAAYLLKEQEKDLPGTVKIIFQPAEEAPGGAVDVLQTGVLDDVQAIFGIHSSSVFPVGTVGIKDGAITAAVDRFAITYTGKGTHAAHPDEGIDPIVAATAFVSAAQSIVSRNVNPFAANLVSITHFQSGTNWNIIPETALLEGTVRTLTVEDRHEVKQRLYTLAENIAKAYGAVAAIDWVSGPPATANDKDWNRLARAEAEKQGLHVQVPSDSLGGEDFAFYQERISGTFIQIGTGVSYPNHNPLFQVDPAALYPASAYVSRLSVRALHQLGNKES